MHHSGANVPRGECSVTSPSLSWPGCLTRASELNRGSATWLPHAGRCTMRLVASDRVPHGSTRVDFWIGRHRGACRRYIGVRRGRWQACGAGDRQRCLPNVPALPNPANDAGDIAAALKRLGFAVTLITNGSFDEMRRGLIALGSAAAGADMAVVYFAGHGMEISGENWLIPVDAELKRDTDAANEAISLAERADTGLQHHQPRPCRSRRLPQQPVCGQDEPVTRHACGGEWRSRPHRAGWQCAGRLRRARRAPRRWTATDATAPSRRCSVTSRRRVSRSPSCSAMSATT